MLKQMLWVFIETNQSVYAETAYCGLRTWQEHIHASYDSFGVVYVSGSLRAYNILYAAELPTELKSIYDLKFIK